MQYSRLASKLRGKINKFSGYVSTNLDKTARRFVREALYGIMSSQSVMLTEIGRSLQTRVSLKKIEDRFCRQLPKKGIWQAIHQNVLADAGPRINQHTLLILDLGDLTKKYARKMQYLTTVRDGSEGGGLPMGTGPRRSSRQNWEASRSCPCTRNGIPSKPRILSVRTPRSSKRSIWLAQLPRVGASG